MAEGAARKVATCPICKSETVARWRPFCSDRCANVDLSRWMSGAYAIPISDADEDEDGEVARPPLDGRTTADQGVLDE